MNATDLIDCVLGQADDAALGRLAAAEADDPALAGRVRRVERGLRALLDDGGPGRADLVPPAGLALATLTLVHEHSKRRRTILDFVPRRLPFRPADVAVAAGVLVAALLTLLPAVQRTRGQMNQAACASNLRQVGRALWLYGARHDHFPFGPEADRDGHAGVFAVMLRDAELLHDRRLLDCPCNGPCGPHPPLPPLADLIALRRADPVRYRQVLCFDYAYNVSFVRPGGKVEPITVVSTATIPLLADQPGLDENQAILPGNSPNHGGRGQNVLFSDLHVGWHNSRRVSPRDPDVFLNDNRQPRFGLHQDDHVLCPPMVPCSLPILP